MLRSLSRRSLTERKFLLTDCFWPLLGKGATGNARSKDTSSFLNERIFLSVLNQAEPLYFNGCVMIENVKKVLMLTSWPPLPVECGGQSATWRVLEYYRKMGFCVDLVSLTPEKHDVETGTKLLAPYVDHMEFIPYQMHYKASPWKHYFWVLQSFLSGRSFMETKVSVPKAKVVTEKFLSLYSYSLIHCEYPQDMQMFKKQGVPVVYFQHNIDYQHYIMKSRQARNPLLKWFFSYQSHLLKKMESRIIHLSDLILCLGRDDRAQLVTLGANTEKLTILNFQLKNEFYPPTGGRQLISMGSLGDPKRAEGTRWFASHVFPLIQERVPDVEWHIVGRFPPADIMALNDNQSIIVHGYMTTGELEQILADTRVCIVPLFMGTGKQMKIDEMTQRGIPCVVTSNGARNTSLDASRGEIFIADDPSVFARHVVQLLTDSAAYTMCRDKLAAAVSQTGSYYSDFQGAIEKLLT